MVLLSINISLYLSIRALSIVSIFISWSDNSNIPVISESGSGACSVPLNFFFFLVCQYVLQFFFFIAGHSVLGKQNGCKQAFRNVVVRCGGGGEVFYSPVIRFESFSEPLPLECELHTGFSVLLTSQAFHPPTQVRQDDWSGLGYHIRVHSSHLPYRGQRRLEWSISFLPHGRLDPAGVKYFPSPRSVRL